MPHAHAKSASAADNPFATRFTSAGTIPYFFSAPGDFDRVVAAGDAANWRAQIVGPHGSGKTTLARHLTVELENRFDRVEFLIVRGFREVQRCKKTSARLPVSDLRKQINANEKVVYVIDGIERLSWLQRKLMVADCKRRANGLLVTAHRRLVDLPVIIETSVDAERFSKILNHLGSNQYADHFPKLADEFGQDCREMLFALYDRHTIEG